MDFSIVKTAFTSVLKDIAQIVPEEIEPIEHPGLLSSVEFVGTNIISYAKYSKEFLRIFSHIILEEDDPSEAMMQDISNECSNIISGKAKAIIGDNVGISIPTYHSDITIPPSYTHFATFLIQPDAFVSLYFGPKES